MHAYLDGVRIAALDGPPCGGHHATGLRHVLSASAAYPRDRLIADLYEPEGVERFLDADWP